jgi:hypothetical protein
MRRRDLKKAARENEEYKDVGLSLNDELISIPVINEINSVVYKDGRGLHTGSDVSYSYRSSEYEDIPPPVRLDLGDIKHVAEFIGDNVEWEENKRLRMTFWLESIVKKCSNREIDMTIYLQKYYSENKKKLSPSNMDEKINVLCDFLKYCDKFEDNMQIRKGDIEFGINGWTLEKFSDLAQDLLHFGILTSKLEYIVASLFVNIMFHFNGRTTLINRIKWNNLRMEYLNGRCPYFAFVDIEDHQDWKIQVSKGYFKN